MRATHTPTTEPNPDEEQHMTTTQPTYLPAKGDRVEISAPGMEWDGAHCTVLGQFPDGEWRIETDEGEWLSAARSMLTRIDLGDAA